MEDLAESLVALGDPLLDLALLAGYVLATAVLTSLGLAAEWSGISGLAAGQVAVGLWYVYMGSVALYLGLYGLGYRKLWHRVGPGRPAPNDPA